MHLPSYAPAHRHMQVGEDPGVSQDLCHLGQVLQDEGRVGHAHAQHAAAVCGEGGAARCGVGAAGSACCKQQL